jgi:uncharacterized protein YgbK (DUF1537 family)
VALRLIADDLTGALDSAAPFAARRGAIPVTWADRTIAPDEDAALDTETRDADADTAAARASELARHLTGADPAFRKLDSVLRGHPAIEIAATIRGGGFRATVIAPAFPDLGRVMRAGRQFVRTAAGGWADTGVDLAAGLAAFGLKVRPSWPEGGGGIFLCDAERQDELAALAARGTGLERPVLWCGSGGLARALAGTVEPLPATEVLTAPVLVVIGTAHPVTAAQVSRLSTGPGPELRRLQLAPDTEPVLAREALHAFAARLAQAPRPASMLVSGGETLMAVCRALGCQSLMVEGEISPGLAVSRMIGGRWNEVRVVSKSGGFGSPDLLSLLFAHIGSKVAHA